MNQKKIFWVIRERKKEKKKREDSDQQMFKLLKKIGKCIEMMLKESESTNFSFIFTNTTRTLKISLKIISLFEDIDV